VGCGFGPKPQSPNPQSPIPNPPFILKNYKFLNNKDIIIFKNIILISKKLKNI
jgi:hypothetical protein